MLELKSVDQNPGSNYFDPDIKKPLLEVDLCNFSLRDWFHFVKSLTKGLNKEKWHCLFVWTDIGQANVTIKISIPTNFKHGVKFHSRVLHDRRVTHYPPFLPENNNRRQTHYPIRFLIVHMITAHWNMWQTILALNIRLYPPNFSTWTSRRTD